MATHSTSPRSAPPSRVVGGRSRRQDHTAGRGMTPTQEKHLASVKKRAAELIDRKYRRGQQEHGGDLWSLPVGTLVDNAIDEAVDQLVYLLTIKDRITKLPRF